MSIRTQAMTSGRLFLLFRSHTRLQDTLVLLSVLALAACMFISTGAVLAQQSYQKLPKEILDILNAPVTPRSF